MSKPTSSDPDLQNKNDFSYILNKLGEDRELYFQAVVPPIMQTSNFAFNKVEDLRKVFDDEYSGFLYSRGLNPTNDILRKKLAALDGAEDCLLFNSGASAIFAAVLANVKSGDHIISVEKPYTWAQKMFEIILPRFGVTTTFINGGDIRNFEQAILPNTKVIYLESPNSWVFELQDLKKVAELVNSKEIVTICDNSYCTPLYQKPIDLGIDIALQSATKFIGGHSDVLGGVLTGKYSMMKKIFDSELLNMGNGITPFSAWLLLRGLRTLHVRLDYISKTTIEVVNYLKKHERIEKVIFPFDEDFPQKNLARAQMKGAAGLFTVVMKASAMRSIVNFCEALQHFILAVSWGGHESLVLPRCASLQAEEFDPNNPEHRMIRFYVGLENADYLIKDLKQAFPKMKE